MNAAIIAQKRTKGLHIDGPSRDFLPIGAKLFGKAAQQGDFLGIARQFIGGFQNERQLAQRGMVHDALECLNADEALADFLVAVFVRTARVFRIVDMHCAQARQPHHAIEFLQHAIEIS